MRVKNPMYVQDTSVPYVKHKDAVLAVLAAAPNKPELTFDEIRAALPKGKADELTDGQLQQLLIDAGFKVST